MLHRHFIISSSSNEVHNIPNNEIHFVIHKYTNLDHIIGQLNTIIAFNTNIVTIEFSDVLERYIITCDDTITTLYDMAFDNLDIITIFLPNSITEIGNYALNAYELDSVVYDGTIEEWSLIKRTGTLTENSDLVIRCTDGDIRIEI